MSLEADVSQTFESHRHLLEGIAYRMLGSLAEAQDVVQDTYLRWSRAPHAEIESPQGWLVTTCSRLALDVLKSARVRRLEYVGTWLPEPFIETSAAPDESSEVDDTVSVALMLALEKLSPAERATFLLHDVFGYDFSEVAQVLGKTDVACRKLASRARNRIQAEKPRFEPSAAEHRRLLEAFVNAARAGEMDALKALLVESVELHADGGGKVSSVNQVMRGSDPVSRFFLAVIRDRSAEGDPYELRHGWFNGAPGLAVFQKAEPIVAYSLDIDPETHQIRKVYALRNPDKLEAFRAWY